MTDTYNTALMKHSGSTKVFVLPKSETLEGCIEALGSELIFRDQPGLLARYALESALERVSGRGMFRLGHANVSGQRCFRWQFEGCRLDGQIIDGSVERTVMSYRLDRMLQDRQVQWVSFLGGPLDAILGKHVGSLLDLNTSLEEVKIDHKLPVSGQLPEPTEDRLVTAICKLGERIYPKFDPYGTLLLSVTRPEELRAVWEEMARTHSQGALSVQIEMYTRS